MEQKKLPKLADPEKYSIIMAGWCGAYGTKLLYELLCEDKEAVKIYPQSFLRNAQDIFEDLSLKEIDAAVEKYSFYMLDAGNTGVFGALWDLAKVFNTGFHVELEKIPIRQETIEFCEKWRLNPYEIPAQGCVLIVTEMPGAVLEALKEKDVPAELIGYFISKKEKCIFGRKVKGEEREVRFLNSPKAVDLNFSKIKSQ